MNRIWLGVMLVRARLATRAFQPYNTTHTTGEKKRRSKVGKKKKGKREKIKCTILNGWRYCVRVHACTRARACIHTCIHACVYTCVHARVCMHAQTHAHIYTCTCTCMHVCARACLCTCIWGGGLIMLVLQHCRPNTS